MRVANFNKQQRNRPVQAKPKSTGCFLRMGIPKKPFGFQFIISFLAAEVGLTICFIMVNVDSALKKSIANTKTKMGW